MNEKEEIGKSIKQTGKGKTNCTKKQKEEEKEYLIMNCKLDSPFWHRANCPNARSSIVTVLQKEELPKERIIELLEKDNTLTPGQILNMLMRENNPSHLITFENIYSIVSNWRRDSNLIGEAALFHNKLTKDGDLFLRDHRIVYDLENDGSIREYKYALWASNWQLKVLGRATKFQVDSSFSIIPMGYYQIFLIMALDPAASLYVPVVFALMNGKTMLHYQLVLQSLIDMVSTLQDKYITIFSDNERAVIKALESKFRNANVKIDLFHALRDMNKKAKKCHLLEGNNKNQFFDIKDEIFNYFREGSDIHGMI